MNHTMKTPFLTLILVAITLSGCFSLSRTETPTEHYVVGASRAQTPAVPADRLAGLSVGLRRIAVADYLVSPLIAVRLGEHRIGFSEYHRWGEELNSGVNRAVAAYLTERADFGSVDVVPWTTRTPRDFLIQIHLLRFEGLAPESEGGTVGEAYMLANWEIIGSRDGAILARGTTDYRGNNWTVGDYQSLVSMLDAGLQALSDDLVAGLEAVAATIARAS
jgi:uncharacterized protein